MRDISTAISYVTGLKINKITCLHFDVNTKNVFFFNFMFSCIIFFIFILIGETVIDCIFFQLMPYFVMHVLNDVPGLGGVFIAALFSGALR